jgi:hypothetical protein
MIIAYRAYMINTNHIAQMVQHSFKKLEDGIIVGGFLKLYYAWDGGMAPADNSHFCPEIRFKDKKQMNDCMTVIYEGFLNSEPLVDLNVLMGEKKS